MIILEQEIIIDIYFYKKELILSPFFSNKYMISNELMEFLCKEIQSDYLSKKIILNFNHNDISSGERSIYKKAIHYTYEKLFEEINLKIKRMNIISFLMFMIGFIILGLAVVVKSIKLNTIFIEVFQIIAWVFVWDSVDIFVFKRNRLKELRNKYAVLKDVNVVFNF